MRPTTRPPGSIPNPRAAAPKRSSRPLRVCLLTNQDLLADHFPSDDWPCDPRPFLPEAHWDVECLTKRTAVAQVTRRIAEGFDLFFNLCDGAADEDSPGIEVVQTLEAHGVAFTGATSTFYEPSREAMKAACRREGIATPRYVFASGGADVERAARELRFPLIVKHHSSYSSVDLSRRSRVVTRAGLRQQARKIIGRHGRALIEEFIEGAEVTVLVAEDPGDPAHPRTYTPLRYRFPAGETFKHERIKWVDYDRMSAFPIEDFALATRLRDICARFFVALGGASFGRCDLRVDAGGTPFMLEINPNCGVYYPPSDPGSADLCLVHDPEGHAGFTRQLVRAALARHRRQNDAGAASSGGGTAA
jgi:D-alanine-D-alanine ligase